VLVLLDTNIWVSATINPSGHPAQVIAAWRARRFDVVISQPLLDELRDVLRRPHIGKRYQITERQIAALFSLISKRAGHVRVGRPNALCRDPRDDVILETAIAEHAAYIVSRDEDITRAPDLAHQLEASGIRIVTVRRFLQEITP
jgi:putative PIN family toxin of toxin-antitoxin system